jgi:hypothetical protein
MLGSARLMLTGAFFFWRVFWFLFDGASDQGFGNQLAWKNLDRAEKGVRTSSPFGRRDFEKQQNWLWQQWRATGFSQNWHLRYDIRTPIPSISIF